MKYSGGTITSKPQLSILSNKKIGSDNFCHLRTVCLWGWSFEGSISDKDSTLHPEPTCHSILSPSPKWKFHFKKIVVIFWVELIVHVNHNCIWFTGCWYNNIVFSCCKSLIYLISFSFRICDLVNAYIMKLKTDFHFIR